MGSMSILHWLVVLLVFGLFFGTGKLRSMGRDLGEAVRSFKEGLNESSDDKKVSETSRSDSSSQQQEK